MSVEELATGAELSVGTIRAIEQGRRAPSEDSGIRILQLLLPDDSLANGNLDDERHALNYSLRDPHSGNRIMLEFGAKTAGDNRRWSVDKPPAGESKAEAFIRELLSDPERSAAWVESMRPAFAVLDSAVADAKLAAELPASDAALGRIMRRLAGVNEFRVVRLTSLMDLWDRVESGTADEWERNRAAELNGLLDGYQEFPHEVDDVDIS